MLTVPCPECGTKLLAPDSAVGQRLRCPKCGTLTPVPDLLPAEEVQVVDAKVVVKSPAPASPPPPPQPKPKPIVAEDATADRSKRATRPAAEVDEGDEDRPRKKKRPHYYDDDDDYPHERRHKRSRRKGGGGTSGALVGGLVIGGLVALAGIGFAVYLFAGKNSPFVRKAPVPTGWDQYTYPQDGFKVYLPPGATHTSIPVNGLGREFDGAGFNGWGGNRGWGIGLLGGDADAPPDVERFAQVSSNSGRSAVRIELYVVKFRDRIPSALRDRVRRAVENKFGDRELRTVRWLGHDALEQTHVDGVMRIVCADRHLILAAIGVPSGGRAKPEEEAGFFDNLELTN